MMYILTNFFNSSIINFTSDSMHQHLYLESQSAMSPISNQDYQDLPQGQAFTPAMTNRPHAGVNLDLSLTGSILRSRELKTS